MSSKPGKFEGEPDYTEYYWNKALDGASDSEYFDDDNTLVSRFNLVKEDFEMFPRLVGWKQIYVWSDTNGFVHHSLT